MKTNLCSKGCRQNERGSAGRRHKWGLGLPKHIKSACIILNIVIILNIIHYYILLVLIHSLLAIPCSILAIPYWLFPRLVWPRRGLSGNR